MGWKTSFSLLSQSDLHWRYSTPLILPRRWSKEIHNTMWPAVRRYIVRKMLFTNKCCTFSIATKSFSLYALPLSFSFIRRWQYPLSRSASQQCWIYLHFLLSSCNLSVLISCQQFALFLIYSTAWMNYPVLGFLMVLSKFYI